jgi:hypothetical protein
MIGYAALPGIVSRIRHGKAKIELAIGRSFLWPADELKYGEAVVVGWDYNTNKPRTLLRKENIDNLQENTDYSPAPDPPSSPPESDNWVMP